MASVNDELVSYREAQLAAGYATLTEVPAPRIDDESIQLQRYRRAVYASVQADASRASGWKAWTSSIRWAMHATREGHLVFLPINGTRSSKGELLASASISRADGDQHRFHTADREAYSGVRAYWHDPKKAKRRGVLVGLSGNAKRLRDTYGSEADALAAAKAEWQRIQRGAATLELTLALGRPELIPQTPVRVSGFKPAINAITWLTVKTAHTVSDGGLTTRIELETADSKSDDGKVEDVQADDAAPEASE